MTAAKRPIRLPIARFRPDMPPTDSESSSNISNVVLRTPQSYGPLSGLSVYSDALAARCQGAAAALGSDGTISLFAGDLHDLYKLTSGSLSWANVSKSAAAYNIAADDMWRFLSFGQRVVASNISDPMQSFLLGTSAAFADLANGGITALALTAGAGYTPGTYALAVTGAGSGTGFTGTVTVGGGGTLTSSAITATGSGYPQTATIAIPAGAGAGGGGAITPTIATIAPKARYAAVVKNFLVAGNTSDATYGAQPQRVWWGALNDPTNWPTPGTPTAAEFQSDFDDLFGDGGWVTGVVGNLGTADGAIFMERAVWRMVYVGPPAVFFFSPAEGVRGCQAPASIVQVGPVAFYLGRDGFYVFDGTQSKPIGVNKIDKYFYTNVNQAAIARVVGAVDPINKLIYWAWPDTTSADGTPNRLAIYNWQVDDWTFGTLTTETLVTALTFSYTLDQLDVFGTLDTMPQFALDSRVWSGGKDILGAFDANHKLNFFNGTALAATIETSEMQPIPGSLALIKNARPLVDGGTPSVAISYRNRLVDAVTTTSPVAMNALGTCPQRIPGRYLRGVTTIPAASVWTHMSGLELEASQAGVR